MKYIQVGYGKIAPLHIRKFRELGAELIGVIEPNRKNQERAINDGITIFDSTAHAARYQPDFWDICTSTENHISAFKQVIAERSDCAIIIEKPICYYSQLDDFKLALSRFRGKLVVNENYFSSVICNVIKVIASDYELHIKNLRIEMSKNRVDDFKKGRFIDTEFGAIGYEGPHMLALCRQLGHDFLPMEITHVENGDLHIPGPPTQMVLPGQNYSLVNYRAVNNVEVELYTSLAGDVRNIIPPIPGLPLHPRRLNSQQRHRIICLEGTSPKGDDIQIIGLYEPVSGCERREGLVAIRKNGRYEEIHRNLYDDSMRLHFHRTLAYFQNKGKNPASASCAMEIAEELHHLSQEKRLVECKAL